MGGKPRKPNATREALRMVVQFGYEGAIAEARHRRRLSYYPSAAFWGEVVEALKGAR